MGETDAWPIVARQVEFNQALTTLTDGSEYQGVALIGSSGVGKTTLAQALATDLETRGCTLCHVFGTRSGAAIPLAAFCRSITVGGACEPAAMLADAYRALTRDHDLVLLVDQAQQLDPLSAVLVSQLTISHRARLILTLRSGEPAPDAITMLIKDHLVRPLTVGPLTREQTIELAQRVLGAATADLVVDELYDRTGGNPLFLRGLLRMAREAGTHSESDSDADSRWQLCGALRSDRELRNLLEMRLSTLTPAELNAVETVAVAELLDWQVGRNLCGVEALAQLERKGVIKLIPDGSDIVVQLTHPILGEGAIELAGVVRIRQLNGVLAQALRGYCQDRARRALPPDVRMQIRLAQFTANSDLEPDLDEILTAAEAALTMSHLRCAEELSRFAFDRGGGLRAATALATALIWRGRSDEAEAVLKAVAGGAEHAEDPSCTRRGCLRAVNLAWGCQDLDAAYRVLAATKRRARSTAEAADIGAVESALAYFSAPPLSGLQPVRCGTDVPPFVTAWTAMTAGYALAAAGRVADVRQTVAAAIGAKAADAPGLEGFVVAAAEIIALAAAGDIPAAQRRVQCYASMAAGIPEARAIIDALAGLLDYRRGALADCCRALYRSAATLARFPSLFRLLVFATIAQAEGARGRPVAAQDALGRAETLYGPQVAALLPELELARGWVYAARGELAAAQEHAVQAARHARTAGMTAIEMRALHTALRFGAAGQTTRLAEIADLLDTPMAATIAAHAGALAAHNGSRLDQVSHRFEELGAQALAADAAAHAAREHGRAGHRGAKFTASTRAKSLAAYGDIRTPAVTALLTPLPITRREREIATMVASGMANRDIADRLFVSVRTVEGHIYRIFAKLGITHRSELIRLIGCPHSPTGSAE